MTEQRYTYDPGDPDERWRDLHDRLAAGEEVPIYDLAGRHIGHATGLRELDDPAEPYAITVAFGCTCIETRTLGRRDPDLIPGPTPCPLHTAASTSTIPEDQ